MSDYIDIYLYDKDRLSDYNSFVEDVSKEFDLAIIDAKSKDGKVYKKILNMTNKKFIRLKLMMDSSSYDRFISIASAFRIHEFIIENELRFDSRLIEIFKKHNMESVKMRKGDYYYVDYNGNNEYIVKPEDRGFLKL